MALQTTNGNGGAVILPPIPKTISGRSLAHKRLDARQKAVLAASVVEGLTTVIPTQSQVAMMLGVSTAYVQIARKLSPGKRTAIFRGWDPTSFAQPRKPRRKVPAVTDASVIDQSDLEDLARTVGCERMLEAAAAAEAAE